jgi:cytochrome c-type biogenesis protein CcmH
MTLAVRRLAVSIVFVLAFAGTALGQVELTPEVFAIASRLRCPVCVSENVAQSASGTAEEMREIIAQQLDAGATEGEILAYFQERYGDWILLEPPRRGIFLVVWLLPAVVAAVLVAGLAILARRWMRNGRAPIDVDEAYLQQLRREAMPEERP